MDPLSRIHLEGVFGVGRMKVLKRPKVESRGCEGSRKSAHGNGLISMATPKNCSLMHPNCYIFSSSLLHPCWYKGILVDLLAVWEVGVAEGTALGVHMRAFPCNVNHLGEDRVDARAIHDVLYFKTKRARFRL